jgi:hypothetical protein
MNGFGLFFWKLIDVLKEFVLFYILILIGEWFVQKRGGNLFERAWIITMIAFGILTFLLWKNIGRLLIFI